MINRKIKLSLRPFSNGKKKKMTRIFLIASWLLAMHGLQAQTVWVLDQETRQPLEFATLSSLEPPASAVTGENGQAEISEFRFSGKIEVRMVGYEPLEISFFDLEKAGFRVYLNPARISLDQVVVSASRWDQSKRETPARITTIGPRAVALQNPQTAADLLGSSGEVFIQKSQLGGGSPMIRGFATNRVLIAVDGMRMNTAIFRSGNLQNVISIDPFAIERTEVLYGPGSVIYGSDAIGGVMHFQTRAPQFGAVEQVNGSGLARYSSASQEFTAHADFQVSWKKWALISSFSHSDFGDLRMGRFGPDEYLRPFYVQRIDTLDVAVANPDPLVQTPTGYNQTNLMQKVSFQPSDKWTLTLATHYATTGDYSRYDRLVRTRDGLPRSAEWAYGPQVWNLNQFTLTRQGGLLFDEMSLRLAWQFFEESRTDRDFNDTERRTRLERVRAGSANLDFIKKAGEKSTLFYGLEGVTNQVESTGTNTDISTGKIETGPARYPQADWLSAAAYATWKFKPAERLTIQAGGRYNYVGLEAVFDTTFFPFPFTEASLSNGAFTGSAGLIYSPNAKWYGSLNLSTGFRSPNVDDVGKVFDSEPGVVIVPNPALAPEYAYNGELSFSRVFGGRVKLELTGFYSILENALVRRDFTLNGQDSIVYDGELSRVQAVQNAARATVYGVQVGLEAKLPGGFGLSGRLNYQKGEEEVDDGTVSPLRHAPPLFGVGRITYQIGSRFLAECALQFSGAVPFEDLPQEEQGKSFIYAIDANGNPWSPGWHTWNLKALYSVTETFTLSAGVENVADLRYRPYSSGIVAPGRNLIFSGKVSF